MERGPAFIVFASTVRNITDDGGETYREDTEDVPSILEHTAFRVLNRLASQYGTRMITEYFYFPSQNTGTF